MFERYRELVEAASAGSSLLKKVFWVPEEELNVLQSSTNFFSKAAPQLSKHSVNVRREQAGIKKNERKENVAGV